MNIVFHFIILRSRIPIHILYNISLSSFTYRTNKDDGKLIFTSLALHSNFLILTIPIRAEKKLHINKPTPMALSIQPPEIRNAESIPTPVDFGSIIDPFIRFRLVHSNNGTPNAFAPPGELPADGREEDVFTWDYDSLHFDDLRLK